MNASQALPVLGSDCWYGILMVWLKSNTVP
jgi:hypothetical protein